jgi:tight adherence protein B
MSPIIAILVGAAAGLWIPHAVVGRWIKGRQDRFIKLFPDAIGLMVRGLRSGLPLVETMIVVGREVAEPVGEEFRRIGEQVKLGQTIQDAMAAAGKRLNLPEFNFLVITFSVQRETGGNLAETLENLDDVLRKRQQMKLKIKAMSSEAVASASIIGCLPFVIGLLIFFVSHDYIMTLFHPGLGYIMLIVAAVMIGIGVLVMSKMVSFEI